MARCHPLFLMCLCSWIFRCKIFLPLFVLFFSLNVNAKEDYSVFFSIYKQAYVETIPYQAFTDDLKTSSYQAGSFAMDHTFLTLGFSYKTWYLGFIQRHHGFANFSPDSAESIYFYANKKDLPADKTYKIEIEASQTKIVGLQIAKIFRFRNALQFKADVNFLYGYLLNEGTLTGDVHADTDSDLSFQNLQLDYTYTEDEIFDRPVDPPTGLGASTDIHMNWQIHPRLMLTADIYNLVSYLNWKNAPNTTAEVNSNKKTYDENGYVSISPSLEGFEGFTSFSQKLTRISHFSADLIMRNNTKFLLDLLNSNKKTFVSVGTGFYWKGIWRVLYNWKYHAPSISYQRKLFSLTLQSDHYSFSEARYVGIDLRYEWEF